MNVIRRSILTAISLLALAGCVGQEAFTKMAQTGDTVSLALGGSPSHELNMSVQKESMTVTITDSASMSYPVKLRYLFKLYPDQAAKLNYGTMYDFNNADYATRAYRQPNLGEWIAIIDLVDPATDVPLPLATGPATIQVTTPDLVDSVPFALVSSDGSLADIKIEILSGTGSPHEFNIFGDPGVLESLPQIVVGFDNSAVTDIYTDIPSATVIGAVGFTIDYDDTFFSKEFPPMVRGNMNDPRILVHAADIDSGGNRVLKVIALTAEKGIVANPDPNQDQDITIPGRKHSKIGDLKIYVTWDPAKLANGSSISAENYTTVFPVSDVSVVDTSGTPLLDGGAGNLVTPVVGLSN